MNIDFDDMAKKDFWRTQGIMGQIMKGIRDKQKDREHYIYIEDLPLIQQKGERGNKMNNKMYVGALTTKLHAEDGKRELIGYASTQCLDRDGEVIKWDAWDLDDYRRNPVLCLAHDYKSLPVGKVMWIKPTQQGLAFRAKFPPPNVSEMSDTVWGLYSSEVMTAFSCGFLPLEFTDNPHAKTGEPVRVYDRVKLLEVSCVAVPSNPHSVVQSIEKSMQAYMARKGRERATRHIIPSWEYISSKDDGFIEIDDQVLMRGFNRVGEYTTRTMAQYLPEMGRVVTEQIGEDIGRMLRKAMGRAF